MSHIGIHLCLQMGQASILQSKERHFIVVYGDGTNKINLQMNINGDGKELEAVSNTTLAD